MPKVSIIIPTYNRKRLVLEAIESIRKQTFKEFEILVIDDGSTDDTAKAVMSIDDSRIRYFYKENGGVSSARNMGIWKAEGQFVAFLDSDDLWRADFLDITITALQRNPDFGVAYGVLINEQPDGDVKPLRVKYGCSGDITKQLFEHFFVPTQAVIVRKEILNGIFFDEQFNMAEDVDFALRLSLQAQFLYCPKAFVIRRLQKNSSSMKNGSARPDESKINVLKRFYYELGGKGRICKWTAARRISKACRRAAILYFRHDAIKATKYLLWQALRFNGLDFESLYLLLLTELQFAKKDAMPDWMPMPRLNTPVNSFVGKK